MRGAYGFGFAGSPLAETNAEDDHGADGEEFKLPVLQRSVPEVRRCDVLDPRQRLGTVFCILLVGDDLPAERLSKPRQQEDRPHQDEERVRVQPESYSARTCPAWRVRLEVLAQKLVLVRAHAFVAWVLGLRRSALNQPDRGEDEEEELEELGLPVLGDVDEEVGGSDELEVPDGRLVVLLQLLVRVGMAGDRLATSARRKIVRKATLSPLSRTTFRMVQRPMSGRTIMTASPTPMIASHPQKTIRVCTSSELRTLSALRLKPPDSIPHTVRR